MLTLLAFALGYGLLFHALGTNWVKCWGFKNRLLVAIFSQVFGLVVAIWVSSIVARLSLPAGVLWATLFLVAATGFLYSRVYDRTKNFVGFLERLSFSARKSAAAFFSTRRILSSLTVVPSIVYAYLATSSPLSNQLSFRVGPDVFGWSRAVWAFCSGDSISELTHRVSDSLNDTELLRAFRRPPELGETSIQQIPSFSDQMAAEFLIGADRSGVPMLAGGFCNLAGGDLALSALGGLVSWAFFVLALIGFFTMSQGVERLGKWGGVVGIGVSVIAPLSFALLSVGLEGGFGQLVTMPLFALSASLLFSETYRVKAFIVSVFLLLIGASTSYIDLVFIAGPFLLIGLILNRRLRITLEYLLSQLRSVALASVIAVLPAAYSMFRIGSAVIETGGAGGWHQGRVILPSNVFGFFSSLPLGGVDSSPRTPTILVLELIITLALVVALFVIERRRASAILIALTFWLLLTLYLYSGDTTNNYILWKYSAYAAALLPILFSGLVRVTSQETRRTPAGSRSLSVAVIVILLFSTISSSLFWGLDWERTKLSSLPREAISELNGLVSQYDIVVLPGALEAAHLAAVSDDLRFGGASRSAFNIQRSLPERPLVVLRVVGGPCEKSCMQDFLMDSRSIYSLESTRIQGLKHFEAFRFIE